MTSSTLRERKGKTQKQEDNADNEDEPKTETEEVSNQLDKQPKKKRGKVCGMLF